MARSATKYNSISKNSNALFNAVMIVGALIVLIPMVLIICVSFSTDISIAKRGFTFIPETWSLDGYMYLMKMGDQVLQSFVITVFITITGTFMSLIVMTMYAYVISQRNFKARRFLTYMLFFTMLFSGGLVPAYMLNVRYLNLKNTVWIFLLPTLLTAYNVIILRTFILTTIPESLLEAGRIDGAGHFRIFLSIVLPLFKAGIATIGLFNVVTRWNDWCIGMLYIDMPKFVPLQTLLYKIQNNIDFLKNNTQASATPDGIQMLRFLPTQSLRMACTMLITLPIMIAYPFFQRYFVSGLTIGSVKG
jgi:putative aldouronate transport system permease protein